MKKLCLTSLLCIFSVSLIIPRLSYAQTQPLDANLQIEYRFADSGASQVFAKIDITNTTSTAYAPDFELQLSGPAPTNVKAFDESGELPIEIVPHERKTGLKVQFIRAVGGKGRTQSATIQYDGPSAVQKDKIWEIAVPAVNPPEFISTTEIAIITPPGFGIPIQTSPTVDTADTLSTNQKRVRFRNQNAKESTVTLRYGHFQTYSFILKYHLQNSSSIKSTQSLHLPTDSFDHLLDYNQIDPKPLNVLVGPEGTWDAVYELGAGKGLDVTVTGIISSEQAPDAYLQSFVSNVQLNPAQYKYDSSMPPEIIWHNPWQYLPFKQNNFEVEISNPNGVALYHSPVVVATNGFDLVDPEKRSIDTLPPYGRITVPLTFKPRIFPPEQPRSVAIGVGTTSITYTIADTYIIIWYASFVIFITATIIILGFTAVKARHLYLQKHRR